VSISDRLADSAAFKGSGRSNCARADERND
jgi:hypothetical protein